jgi:hypothetical protein
VDNNPQFTGRGFFIPPRSLIAIWSQYGAELTAV